MGVFLRAYRPLKGPGSLIRWMASSVRHRGYTRAVAVVHRAHEDLASSVLRQLRRVAVRIMSVREHRSGLVHGLGTGCSVVGSGVAGAQRVLRGLVLTCRGARSWSQIQTLLLRGRAGRGWRLHEARAGFTTASCFGESRRVSTLL